MIGSIGISDLKVNCVIGIYPHERTIEQNLFIDIKIKYDFQHARQSENVKDTIDYAQVAEIVTSLGVKNKYQLIETYAEDAAQSILETFKIDEVYVKIKKPGAVKNADYPFVEITRNKK